MENLKLKNALYNAGIRKFEGYWMSSPKHLAQRALDGRTHYASDSTLAFFNARILETRQSDNGLWFALRESVEYPGSGRVQRWALFDVFGQCERTEFATGKKLESLYVELRDGIEWEARTLDELKRKALNQISEAKTVLRALECEE
jgi:hypothetical protein